MSEVTERRLAAILAADVVGYSRLMEADETGTHARMKVHRETLWRPLVARYGGRVVGTAGDSLLVEFASAVAALECAVAVQRGMAEASDSEMRLRIGINIGEVIVDGDDIYGDGVNVAARLEGLCEPGAIAISANVHEQVRGKVDIAFEDAGDHEVKNIARPIHVWRWSAAPGPDAADRPADPPRPELPDRPSIAILPFDNMSGDTDQEYFSDGITEDITTELSRFHELYVIARNTAFTYKGRELNLVDVARELGVHFILEGSVRKAGNRVRITAQLIDGADGNHLWAERYDGGVEEIFELQDEVTRQVASAIMPQITDAALARMRRGDQVFDEAHDLAWRAWDEALGAERLARPEMMCSAREMAREALALNEHCLHAHATICFSAFNEYLLQWAERPAELLSELGEAAETFNQLFPNSHRAHLFRGIANMMADRNGACAADLRHSLSLNPNDTMVLSVLAYAEAKLGNLEAVKTSAAKAIRLNPRDIWTGTAYLALAQVAFVEDDEAFKNHAEEAIRAQPNGPIRRALMVAHGGEIGDSTLVRQHREHLDKVAPAFISRLIDGKLQFFENAEYQRKLVRALEKALVLDGAEPST